VKHDKHGKMRFYPKKRNGFMDHLTKIWLSHEKHGLFRGPLPKKGLKRSDLAMKKIEK